MGEVSRGTVDSLVGCGVCDLVGLRVDWVVVDEERIVWILHRVPLIELRQCGVSALEKLFRNMKPREDMGREILGN